MEENLVNSVGRLFRSIPNDWIFYVSKELRIEYEDIMIKQEDDF